MVTLTFKSVASVVSDFRLDTLLICYRLNHRMKRVLWWEIFIIVIFAVRASKYPSHGWHPPPPTRFARKSKESYRSQSNSRHSEWTRMRRRPKPSQSQYSSGYDHNDDGRRRRQDHYRRYEEEGGKYDAPQPPGHDFLYYRDAMRHQLYPEDIDEQIVPSERFRMPDQANNIGQRQRQTKTRGKQNQRRRIDSMQFHYQGLSTPYDKLDEEEHAKDSHPTTTTTQEPFHISDVKVPTAFLRIEYMISFSFLGLMYGLGFLVIFQSLCVPAAKISVVLVYYALLKAGLVEPYTVQDALEQMPPL